MDSAGTVQFGSPVYAVKKYGGFALIPVVRTGGSVGTVTVDYTTLDGTAIAGTNYVATSGTVDLHQRPDRPVLRVPIIDNGVSNGLTDADHAC